MQTMLAQRRDPNLRAYFVWGPYLDADNAQTARESASRYQAPNSAYYWTSTPGLAQELASVLRLPGGRLAWDVYLLYRKGVLWETSFPIPAYWQRQLDILQGDDFDITKMESRIQSFLGQMP